jgi:hypothetical protein
VDACWTKVLACATIAFVHRLALLASIAVSVGGLACGEALHLGVDASPSGVGSEVGPEVLGCPGEPPESCGYACQGAHWVRIPLLCSPDGADAGRADTAPSCIEGASNDGGTAASCPCLPALRRSCASENPEGLACASPGLECNYAGNGCGIVSCSCMLGDGGAQWSCPFLLI